MLKVFIAMTCLLVLASTAGGGQLANARQGVLPVPSGTRGIGRKTLQWTDRARIEQLAPDRRNRELVVDIGYPAEPRTGSAAQYINVAAFDQALGVTGLRSLVGDPAADLLRAGGVQTHATEGAP